MGIVDIGGDLFRAAHGKDQHGNSCEIRKVKIRNEGVQAEIGSGGGDAAQGGGRHHQQNVKKRHNQHGRAGDHADAFQRSNASGCDPEEEKE